jgi:hypothetical protein
VQRAPKTGPMRLTYDGIVERRGGTGKNLAKVAAGPKLLTLVYYGLPSGTWVTASSSDSTSSMPSDSTCARPSRPGSPCCSSRSCRGGTTFPTRAGSRRSRRSGAAPRPGAVSASDRTAEGLHAVGRRISHASSCELSLLHLQPDLSRAAEGDPHGGKRGIDRAKYRAGEDQRQIHGAHPAWCGGRDGRSHPQRRSPSRARLEAETMDNFAALTCVGSSVGRRDNGAEQGDCGRRLRGRSARMSRQRCLALMASGLLTTATACRSRAPAGTFRAR